MPGRNHADAPTRFVEAGGVHFAYRTIGGEAGIPLLCLQHFRGGLDHWDPFVTDGLGAERPVIVFDNTGVGSSSGETPDRIDTMADAAVSFLSALELKQVDVLGFSMGGYVAQSLALRYPQSVRKIVLVGTGPRGGEPSKDEMVGVHATRPDPDLDDYLYLFFGRSEKAKAAGAAFWGRRHARMADRDKPTSVQTMAAQLAAMKEHRESRGVPLAYLREIAQQTLVVNGTDDVMVPTVNSFLLQQNLPRAQLILYPDAGHAAHFQYPELFCDHVRTFLSRDWF